MTTVWNCPRRTRPTEGAKKETTVVRLCSVFLLRGLICLIFLKYLPGKLPRNLSVLSIDPEGVELAAESRLIRRKREIEFRLLSSCIPVFTLYLGTY